MKLIQYCNQYLLVLSNEINTRKYRIILETSIVKISVLKKIACNITGKASLNNTGLYPTKKRNAYSDIFPFSLPFWFKLFNQLNRY